MLSTVSVYVPPFNTPAFSMESVLMVTSADSVALLAVSDASGMMIFDASPGVPLGVQLI